MDEIYYKVYKVEGNKDNPTAVVSFTEMYSGKEVSNVCEDIINKYGGEYSSNGRYFKVSYLYKTTDKDGFIAARDGEYDEEASKLRKNFIETELL